MRYIIETTKTEVGKRRIPITDDVEMMFQTIIGDGEAPKKEKIIDGLTISIEYRFQILRYMYVDILIIST